MFSTYFDESQKQLNDWQNQFGDWQNQFFNTWLETLPNAKGEVNFTEAFDKALTFQEEVVRSYLEAQEKSSQMMLESQKKFWSDYFEALRKRPPAGNSTVQN